MATAILERATFCILIRLSRQFARTAEQRHMGKDTMMAQATPQPSYVIARSLIQSLAPQEIEDIPDYEAAFELRRRGQAVPDGLGLGMADVILAVGPIAYFIGG